MTTVKDVLKKLMDVFAKNPLSVLGKIISIVVEQIQELEATAEKVREWRDIDNAEGTTLDRIGKNAVQPRGVATDEVYRIMIKTKIARNFSTGSLNSIIGVLSIALDVDPSEIKIKEMFTDASDPEPAAISLVSLPITKINEAGMTPVQFAKIVQKAVASGVRVGVVELTGAFSFASGTEVETDTEAGFSDEEGTTGGYLGAAYSPGDEEEDLPV